MAAAIDVRLARESDMSYFAAIVNYFIETTTVNFRTHPQSADEWRDEWKLLGGQPATAIRPVRDV